MKLTPEQIEFNMQTQQKHAQLGVKLVLDRINIPDDWNSLEEFTEWFKAAGYPILPPADTRVYVSDISYSTIVFRRGRFQAELYFVAPNAATNVHTHNHSSKFIILAGSSEGYYDDPEDFIRVGKRSLPPGKDDVDPDFSITGLTCHVGDNHGFRTLEYGLVFFNLEMWPEDIVPTSALVEFEGPAMGPKHETMMQDFKHTKK